MIRIEQTLIKLEHCFVDFIEYFCLIYWNVIVNHIFQQILTSDVKLKFYG